MSIKYYTHFLLQERSPKGMSEFRGVVEVSRDDYRRRLEPALEAPVPRVFRSP